MTNNAYDPVKRILDVVAASVGLIFLSPVLGVIALSVRKSLGSPVMFKQERPGKDEEIFTLRKFRTMKDIDYAKGVIEDEDRLTSFGSWLRSTSLDELPELLNVLKGEMSLVGPRPLLVSYLDLYTPAQARRHDVRPGITGLAQVKGRNALSWDEKFALDREYVDAYSLSMDLQILLTTVVQVFRRSGVSQPGHATMPAFEGASTEPTGGVYR